MLFLRHLLLSGRLGVVESCLRLKIPCRNYKKLANGTRFRIGRKSIEFVVQTPAYRYLEQEYEYDDDDDDDQEEDLEQEHDPEVDCLLNDSNHNQFTRLIYSIPGAGHRIFLLQPHIKRGPNWQHANMIPYLMDEGVALIETLDNWKVVDKFVLATKTPLSRLVFGSGNIEKLQAKMGTIGMASATFINIDKLSGLQHAELEQLLGMPVFDRYSIVLQIFKDHAKSRISKLQVALAEIPHLRSMIKWVSLGGGDKQSGDLQHIGGTGETFSQKRKQLLLERETKLNNAIQKYKSHRQMIRKNRRKKDIAIVAVVGYTNSGKTTLIKTMTGDKKMIPMDQLFATLDVTAHGGKLLNRMSVIYVDTVGFISDIPTSLIESFQSTLEDVAQADLIVHIRDISHPNTDSQRICVLETLKQLNLPNELIENIIEIGNKMDKLEKPNDEHDHDQCMLVSATKGTGLADLQKVIEEKLIATTSTRKLVFRVPNGGEEFRWLHKEAAVSNITTDTDNRYLLLDVAIGKIALSKFHHYFGEMEVTINENKN